MRRIGALNEWARFLDARNDADAAAELNLHIRRLDGVYESLCSVGSLLSDSPTGEVLDVLSVARSTVLEAIGMLESVRARFNAGERETA